MFPAELAASLSDRLRVPVLLAILIALLALPPAALAQGGGQGPPSGQPPPVQPPPSPELVVEEPAGKPLVYEGQSGRLRLGGTWYFRQDDTFVGDVERWFEQEDLVGWTPVRVPHNWNATDLTENRATVGWYRKEFTLPRQPKGEKPAWKVRFEGSNYRTWVWLNGVQLGTFTGYFPFELDLNGLRRGQNSLVVKVSSLRSRTDLTHWRPANFNGYGTGGWWNFGGLLREVYVRKIDTIDIEDVQVLPRLRKVGDPAKVEVRATVRNMTAKDRNVTLSLNVGGERFSFDPADVLAGNKREIVGRITIDEPRLWQPGDPELYGMAVTADETLGRGRRARTERRAVYKLRFGIKKLETTRAGQILLNGKRLNLRGASIHEDDMQEGGALSQQTRRLLVSRLRDLGGTVTRSHYPLHPAFIELLDRYGILYWVDAPVWQVPNAYWNQSSVRAAAKRAVALTVRNNVNHASIMTWSLANEPAETGSDLGLFQSGLVRYIRAASAEVREMDDTRLVAIERQSRIGEPPTTEAHRYLDVLGVNEYFGWYRSVREDDVARASSLVSDLSSFLDAVHAANPSLPLMVTEYGAEASRPGPAEQKGTYEFQQRFVRDHLAVHSSKPYVAGSIHWALRDFRVYPKWSGGAPDEWATPPWHNKSLIEETNARKPAYFDMRTRWRRTKPLLPVRPVRRAR